MSRPTTEALATSVKQEFITLDRGPFWVVHWCGGHYGPAYSNLKVGDQTLEQFLEFVWTRLTVLQKQLNEIFKGINTEDLKDEANRLAIGRFMENATWAMSTALLLRPYMEHYNGCPTNFLYVDFIFRLEEIYTKCLAAAYIFGTDCEMEQAHVNLVHDFVHMGGISDDGGPGNGLGESVTAYYRAFFSATNRHPLAYQKFGEFISRLAKLVQKEHPKAVEKLSWNIKWLLESDTHGFASKLFISPAKSAMLEVLQKVVTDLQSVTAALKEQGEKVA